MIAGGDNEDKNMLDKGRVEKVVIFNHFCNLGVGVGLECNKNKQIQLCPKVKIHYDVRLAILARKYSPLSHFQMLKL